MMIAVSIIITFFLLNLNNGVAMALSFWAILLLPKLIARIPRKNPPKVEMSFLERRALEGDVVRAGFCASTAEWIKTNKGKEELKKYYENFDPNTIYKIKELGWYNYDEEFPYVYDGTQGKRKYPNHLPSGATIRARKICGIDNKN